MYYFWQLCSVRSPKCTSYRVPEIEHGSERSVGVMLQPVQVQIVPNNRHRQRALDGHEPFLNRALELGLAFHVQRVANHLVSCNSSGKYQRCEWSLVPLLSVNKTGRTQHSIKIISMKISRYSRSTNTVQLDQFSHYIHML